MAAVERLLGPSPRTKVAEALLRLGDLQVSRADIAKEAGLFRASTNRILADFEAEGIVTRVGEGKRPLLKANLDSPYLLLLARFSAALELVNLTEAEGSRTPVAAHAVEAQFVASIGRMTGTLSSGVGSAVIAAPSPGFPVRKVITA